MYTYVYVYVCMYILYCITLYVNVKCPNLYIKNKTFIIRSYISVSSKPSKTEI